MPTRRGDVLNGACPNEKGSLNSKRKRSAGQTETVARASSWLYVLASTSPKASAVQTGWPCPTYVPSSYTIVDGPGMRLPLPSSTSAVSELVHTPTVKG